MKTTVSQKPYEYPEDTSSDDSSSMKRLTDPEMNPAQIENQLAKPGVRLNSELSSA